MRAVAESLMEKNTRGVKKREGDASRRVVIKWLQVTSAVHWMGRGVRGGHRSLSPEEPRLGASC